MNKFIDNRTHNVYLSRRRREGGAIMLITLVTLVLLLLATMALVRSMDVSLVMSGNLAFKRDLVNQGERGMFQAIRKFTETGGSLNSMASRIATSKNDNYSAVKLADNPQGVPLALMNDTTFNSVGKSSNDISPSGGMQITVRYLIDRLCSAEGDFASDKCVYNKGFASDGGGSEGGRGYGPGPKISKGVGYLCRISVRATGPRNTQTFMQTMFACATE
jgi:hypothetical protein